MQDKIYYLIIVTYYFWYFYVKNVILGLGDLFPYFQVHLNASQVKFDSSYGQVSIRSYLEYIFLFVKFYRALKQAPKSVNIFQYY